MTWRAIYARPIARHVIDTFESCLLQLLASYDAASNICEALMPDINQHFTPSISVTGQPRGSICEVSDPYSPILTHTHPAHPYSPTLTPYPPHTHPILTPYSPPTNSITTAHRPDINLNTPDTISAT